MEFRIADTFTDSLARLGGEDQKAAKLTAFELQMSQGGAGQSFHRLDHARDKNFWSVRAGRDLRLIVHRSESSMLICYVDHHDAAYQWAERRKLETHPRTGAAQLVEIRETVQEILIPRYVEGAEVPARKPALFGHVAAEDLLSYGVPVEWLGDVRDSDEDALLALMPHLPTEAQEALWVLLDGGKPATPAPPEADSDPFDHPDSQRRFRVVHDIGELERALDFPWDKWTLFLHPAQRQWVDGNYNGPARVSGSAGTGKTVVALHRSVHLARQDEDARILLTTFSPALAARLRSQLHRLVRGEPRLAERIEVEELDGVALRLYERNIGPVKVASNEEVGELLTEVSAHSPLNYSLRFLLTEWRDVVDAWQISTWEAYRDVARLGRKTRLPEAQRAALWRTFELLRNEMAQANLTTAASIYARVTAHLQEAERPVYDFAIVDEAQDVGVPQLRFLAALAGDRANGLFFAGDLGQRIFQQPFSWRSLGVDVRGRSRTLRINYRTSHQIRTRADRLLGPEVSDVDGNSEERSGTVSVFNGPAPEIMRLASLGGEVEAVATWLQARLDEGVSAGEIGVFVRSESQLARAETALQAAGCDYTILTASSVLPSEHASLSTMHDAKGLEFRAVAVMACDDDVLPLQERIEDVTDDSDLREVYDTERHLLYVACTRARDYLLVTSGDVPSEFLDDLGSH